MIALTTIIYIALIVVFYKVMKIKPNPKNVAVMVVMGVVVIGGIVILWQFSAPNSSNLVVSRYTVQIVPQVKGPITKIHAQPNVPLKKGEDILFEIQKDQFQFAVDQFSASLAAARKDVERFEASVQAAKAGVNKAQANLEASKFELEVAQNTEKLNPDAIAKLKVKQLTEQYNASVAGVDQAKAATRQAEASLESAKSQGVSIQAQLDSAEFNLKQCVVYAPADGFVTNWQVREGTMAVSLPLSPMGTFVDTSQTILVANFGQNVVKNVKPDQPVEIALKNRPGEVFPGKVVNLIQASGEGQFVTSGQLISAADIQSEGMFAVTFKLDDDEVAKQLAMGTAGTVVVYTDKGKPFHAISKVVIRMNAWQYYLFPF